VSHVGGKHIGISLAGNSFPLSINEAEFNFMRDTIVNNDLKSGFELATGTGISTIAIATAFSKTKGHFLTFDSYYEYITKKSSNIPVGDYSRLDVETIKECEDYKFVSGIIGKLNLSPYVNIIIGWSPTDTTRALREQNKPLDFVFLDCPKSDSEFERDITSLRPFIGAKYSIFVHDSHTFTTKSFDLVKRLFGREMKLIHDYYRNTPNYSHRHFPLANISTLA